MFDMNVTNFLKTNFTFIFKAIVKFQKIVTFVIIIDSNHNYFKQ